MVLTTLPCELLVDAILHGETEINTERVCERDRQKDRQTDRQAEKE